jgi:hypothetical protein
VPYIKDVRQTSVNYIKNNILNPMTTGYNRRVTPLDMEDYKRNLGADYYPELQAGANPLPVPQQGDPILNIQNDPKFQDELKKRFGK